ncbi:hypothetical protein A0H76_93 [Hepatospora eriocheir]|uniref:DUF8032 domain-containing protein n=1 Tax=Hepatospora eriocheir TaxID=1081669 RepID=A0A1X0QJ96_9MICR|nr:hypothetical protein A0H76_93 [Hepatospora eriocheir]
MENEFNKITTSNDKKIKFIEEDSVYNYENLENVAPKKKRERKKRDETTRRNVNRKNVNLPASQPYVKIIDGEEKMAFKYNTRLSESALSQIPKESIVEDEFTIYFNVESVDITSLNEKFKMDNCVYPRANVPIERYAGNRWSYETECNKLAWQLVSLNSSILYGRKGLIQRAVDSYRYLTKSSKGSKYYRNELFNGEIEKRKKISNLQSVGQFEYTYKRTQRKCKVFLNINHIDFDQINDKTKSKYSVFVEDYDENSFGKPVMEYKNEDNILAIKLGYLNVENTGFQNAIKLIGVTNAIRGLIEIYKSRKEEVVDINDEEIENVVKVTLDKAIEEYDGNVKDYYYNLNNKT